MSVENPMIVEEREPRVVTECDGCLEEIFAGEEVYVFDGGITHRDSECCKSYIANKSVSKVAGEG